MAEHGEPAAPPDWALLQRALLTEMTHAAEAFIERYTRDDGTWIWRDEWPGMDGSDDAYESFGNFPLFYALGGGESVHRLARFEWEATTRQFTDYGQVHREFDAYYDWMHHGESSQVLYYFGLADPTVAVDRERALRFADMYTGDDPAAPNYDPERRLIRSPFTGSRGPRFEVTVDDWCTHRPVLDNYPPPFDDIPLAPGPLCRWTDDAVMEQILERMNQRMSQGDVPLNLAATSLVTSAFLYSGDERYRQWVLDYTDAWRQRAAANGGLIPDNVGLGGEIGENLGGAWWGGYYGYRWPHGINTVVEPVLMAAGNCLLLTGDRAWLEFPRQLVDRLCDLGEMRDGRLHVPHRHTDAGWTAYRPMDPRYLVHLWYWSNDDADRQRIERITPPDGWADVAAGRDKGDQRHAGPWYAYANGRLPNYPSTLLRVGWREMLRRLEAMRTDDGDPAEWDVHHWQDINPVGCEALVQTTLGAPMPIYHGGLLHSRLRWFDPERNRPGLPRRVAALVESVDPAAVRVRLHNLDPLAAHDIVVQGGAFGEHRIETLTVDGEDVPVSGRTAFLRLAPGCACDLTLRLSLYAQTPTYAQPVGEPVAGG